MSQAHIINDENELDYKNLFKFFFFFTWLHLTLFEWTGGEYLEYRSLRTEFDRQHGPMQVHVPSSNEGSGLLDTVLSDLVTFAKDSAKEKRRPEPQESGRTWC